MNRVSIKFFLVWITYQILVHVSRCDLPNHATIHDVHGKWKLSFSTGRSQPDSCGSKAPNENLDNLAQDDEAVWRETPVAESRIIHLSDERIPLRDIFDRERLKAISEVLHPTEMIIGGGSPQFRLSWEKLPVYEEIVDENGSVIKKLIGHWTMTFDEGFEVLLEDNRYPETGTVSRFLLILKYKKVDKDHCAARSPANGDNESPDGSTPCYETDPSTTFVGWGTISHGDGKKQYSCVQGSKVDVLPVSGRLPFEKLATVQVVRTPMAYQAHGIKTAKKAESRSLLIDDTNVGFSFLQSQHSTTIHTGLYACVRDTLGPDNSLPSQFTWGDSFNVPKWSHFPDEELMDQGGCGSCYAIASAYVLQERSKALLKILLGDDHDVAQYFAGDSQLSPQSILSCSYFSQGCNGGLPYNVGRFSDNIGIPTRKCMDYIGSDRAPCSMKDVVGAIRGVSRNHSSRAKRRNSPSAILSPTTGFVTNNFLQREDTSSQCDNRVFALDYGYVGGCYECCAERHMMEEVFHGGPVIVAFDAPLELFRYKDGVFEKSPNSHTKICSEPGKGLNGWEFTTHALVLVGWGEDEQSGPYWILRNSWGNKWGRDGYFKLKRGQNIGGVEAQAVFIDPDPTRGLLKSILEMNGVPKEKIHAVRRNGLQYKMQTGT